MKRAPEYLLILYALTGTISIAISQTVMALGAVVALVDRGRRTLLRRPVTHLEGPLLAWTVATILATVFASDPAASAVKMKKVLLMGMVFWAPAVIGTRWNLGRLFMALLFSAGVTSLYGILTFLLQDEPQLGSRIRGFHGFYLTNSGILLLCTFAAGLFATCPVVRTSHRWGAAIVLFSILTVQLFGLLPSAWIGTIAGFLALAARRRRPGIALAVVAVVASLWAVPGPLRDTSESIFLPESPANLERIRVARNGSALFAQDPLTGWGLNDLRQEYMRVKQPGDPVHDHMGSVYVQVGASMGLPGILAFVWIVAASFREIARARRAVGEDPFLRTIVDGTEAGFVAFLAAGLVQWNLGDSEILALLFFLLGTAIAAGQVARRERRAEVA